MESQPDRRTSLFAAAAAVVVAGGARLAPLWWSPLPANLDGFDYAALARDTLAAGRLPAEGLLADAITSTVLLSTGAEVTGEAPLLLAQPLYAVAGSGAVLLGFVFVRRLGRARGWSNRRTRTAGVVAAFALAVDGIVVRQGGTPDDDVFTLLLIPLAAYLAVRYASSGRARWLLALAPLLVVLPLTHTFSTLVAGMTLLVVAAAQVGRDGLTRPAVTLSVVVAGFWAYFAGYYRAAPSLSLVVPYVDRVSGSPGLFLAWTVALVVGVLWFRRASRRARRVPLALALAVLFGVVAVNAVSAVFPGTSQTPAFVLALVAPLAVPAMLAAWGGSLLADRAPAETALLAILSAPLVLVLFTLTVALTPEYAATAMRAQTHLHLPVLVVAAAVATRYLDRSAGEKTTSIRSRLADAVGPVLVAALVVAALATLPLAYVHLDTGTFPATTTESEFAGSTFAATSIPGQWTTSHTFDRPAHHYYPNANGSIRPTGAWIRGGPPPDCPVLSRRAWTRTGAHLFPSAPSTVSPGRYDDLLTGSHVVYAGGSGDRITVTVPAAASRDGC